MHPQNGVEFCVGCSQCLVEREKTAGILRTLKLVAPPPRPTRTRTDTTLAAAGYDGYAARVLDDTDCEGAARELDAAILEHGLGALACGRLPLHEAIEWLQSHNAWDEDAVAAAPSFAYHSGWLSYQVGDDDARFHAVVRSFSQLLEAVVASAMAPDSIASSAPATDDHPRLKQVVLRPYTVATRLQALVRGRIARRCWPLRTMAAACIAIQRRVRGRLSRNAAHKLAAIAVLARRAAARRERVRQLEEVQLQRRVGLQLMEARVAQLEAATVAQQ